MPPGFPNDTALSRLSSGELVVDRADTNLLQSFLRRERASGGIEELKRRLDRMEATEGGSRNLDLRVVLGEREFARTVLDIGRRGFRTA